MSLNPTSGAVVAGAAAVALLAVGWFVLSWRVGHTAPADALGEALGVALGLLIVASAVGAFRSRNRSDVDGDDDV